MKNLIKLTLTLFALHLLYSNTVLLLQANEIPRQAYYQLAAIILFAGSYSVITILILSIYPRIWLIYVLASLDLTCVFLKYAPIETSVFQWFTAAYFSLYTGMIAISIGLYQNKNHINEIKPAKADGNSELEAKKAELKRLKNKRNPMKNEKAKADIDREIERVKEQIKELENGN